MNGQNLNPTNNGQSPINGGQNPVMGGQTPPLENLNQVNITPENQSTMGVNPEPNIVTPMPTNEPTMMNDISSNPNTFNPTTPESLGVPNAPINNMESQTIATDNITLGSPIPMEAPTEPVNFIDNPMPQTPSNAEPTVVSPTGEPVNFDNMPSAPTVDPNASNNANGVVGLDPMLNTNINGFVEPNKVENIGAMPPKNDEPKGKKPNKIVFIILVLALIAGVAYGVYYYLSVSKTKVTVTPKENIEISINEKLSSDPGDYALIKGTDSSNCTRNVDNVNTSKPGVYEYTVTCNGKDYKGKITVKDMEGPELAVKIVYTTVNNTVDVNSFVTKCEDPSGCVVSFVDPATATNYMNTAGGPYDIDIIAKDSLDNTTKAKAILYVVPYDIQITMVFDASSEKIGNVTKTVSDKLKFGYNETIVYLNAGRREYKYVFSNKQEYEAAVGDKTSEMTYDNMTGLAFYDDENLTLTISTNLDQNTLNSEASGAFPTAFNDIRTLYENKGYEARSIEE